MGMFDKLIANFKASKKTIVFTEGSDNRILSATDRLLKEGLMGVILCGNPDDVKAAAAKRRLQYRQRRDPRPCYIPRNGRSRCSDGRAQKGQDD